MTWRHCFSKPYLKSFMFGLIISFGTTALPMTPSFGLEFKPASFTKAAQDFQRDMSRIIENLRRFNENSNKSTYAKDMKQIKMISATNDSILRDISFSITTFKRNLERNRDFLPTREIKESPAYSTLMKMAVGYEDWLRYQKKNQLMFDACVRNSGKSKANFDKCSVNYIVKGLENERLGRLKLQQAADEYNRWMKRFGHS